jgi:hypothetical protein
MTGLVRARYTLEFKQEAVRLVPGKANDLRQQPKRERRRQISSIMKSLRNVTELENAIHEWIEHRNQDPKPFTWTASPNPSSPPIAEPKKPWPSSTRK